MPHTLRHLGPDTAPAPARLPSARLRAAAAARAQQRLDARLRNAHRGRLRARTALRLAQRALAAGRVAETDRLLELVPAGTPGLAGARARRHRHVGRISEAVVGLRRAVAAGRATTGERRQLHHYEDELRLLSGWRPALTPVVGYRAEPASVLHVLAPGRPPHRAPRAHALLCATVAQGWTVTTAARPGAPAGGPPAAAGEVVDGVAHHRLPPAGRARTATGRLQQEAQSLLELALRTRPAVLHTVSRAGNALVTRAVAEALGVPWVYEVQELPADRWASARPAEAATSERHRLSGAREAEALAAADDVLVPSRAMRERVRELTRSLPSGPVPVRVTPPAVDGPYLAPPRPAREARRVLGLPEGARVVGAVADLVEHEGLDDLLRAAARITAQVPGLLVLLVGDGPARPALEALADELGLGGRVRFPGAVTDARAVLYQQAFDVFAAPRRDHPVTRVAAPAGLVEALAAGTPVVASRLPVLAETVADGITGMLTPAQEPETLAAVLRMLLECPAVRRCLGDEARRRGARTWHDVAQDAVEAYEHLTLPGQAQEATA